MRAGSPGPRAGWLDDRAADFTACYCDRLAREQAPGRMPTPSDGR